MSDSVREVIAKGLAESRIFASTGGAAINSEGRIHVEFYDDADAVLAVLDAAGIVLCREQVGWLALGGCVLLHTEDLDHTIPVYVADGYHTAAEGHPVDQYELTEARREAAETDD